MITIDEKLKKEIGLRIKKQRQNYGYTIDKLVEILSNDYYIEIDEKSIRRYEKGEFMPKIDNLIALSEIFGVSLDYLVFGKQTSNDNSFLWTDAFKRLNRLIYSCVIIPQKENDPQSPYYGKYYFIGYDEELQLYVDKLFNFAKEKNYKFEVRNKDPYFNINDLDKFTEEYKEYKEVLLPDENRLNEILLKAGEDPETYRENRTKTIIEKRKA